MRMPTRVFRWFELRVGACFGWRCGVWAAGGGLLGVWWRAGSPGRVILGQPGTDDKRTHRAQKSLSLTAESPLGLESNCAPRASPLRTPERMRSCRHSFDADDASEWSMRCLPSQMSPRRGSRQVGRIMSQTCSAACPKVGTSERWVVGSLPACASALISSRRCLAWASPTAGHGPIPISRLRPATLTRTTQLRAPLTLTTRLSPSPSECLPHGACSTLLADSFPTRSSSPPAEGGTVPPSGGN